MIEFSLFFLPEMQNQNKLIHVISSHARKRFYDVFLKNRLQLAKVVLEFMT